MTKKNSKILIVKFLFSNKKMFIESLGTGAVPVIAGITLGDVLLDVDVQQKLTTKWGVLKGRI